MTVQKEFLVERQGKKFVLYAGLLDEAHQQGLKLITTDLVQKPTEENGHVAICRAVVETSKGCFSGIGDADPKNVNPQMRSCLIRMAETRAKARALRDAVNVAVAALEELGDVDEEDLPRYQAKAESASRQRTNGKPAAQTNARTTAQGNAQPSAKAQEGTDGNVVNFPAGSAEAAAANGNATNRATRPPTHGELYQAYCQRYDKLAALGITGVEKLESTASNAEIIEAGKNLKTIIEIREKELQSKYEQKKVTG